MSEKITGYLLLAIGVVVILCSAVSVYSVFTGKTEPITLFRFPALTIQPGTQGAGQQALPIAIPSMELIPSSMVNQIANLAAYTFLMSFLSGIGYKIASLGIQLLRPIKINPQQPERQRPKTTSL
ncbi:hypothetical protein KKB64_03740 [Patescibacteria group bacterium]|nr:hypothetical protein [Patescibacteria group bacterium]MBU1472869.1 hypothetical protein [Patescibacteria group bacterium]MBU2460069.1 hypothetical protein [Patescibacteria group bacterium]MBU2544765.1 hypothetical protein [Patescibacteria group bacterium]